MTFDTKSIDILNIFIVIISLIIAVIIPFELFLFSYAVLGPLHYLTEISWLHKKNFFFSASKNWSILLVILTVLISIYPIIKFFDLGINESLHQIIKLIGDQYKVLLLIGFLFAVGLIFFRKFKQLVLIFFLVTVISFISANYLPTVLIFIGLFLPTLIHVYIFTLLFILYGALKSKSKFGIYLSILVFIVPVIILFVPLDSIAYEPSDNTRDAYISSTMANLSGIIASVFDRVFNAKIELVTDLVIRIQIFIAFAYTYHYLNWFSKTSIIGWQKTISSKRAFLILFIWLASIALYLYDFKIGLLSLFFLSLLHVVLEFPLNAFTIKEVFLITTKRITGKGNT